MTATLRSAATAPRWILAFVVAAHAGAVWQMATSAGTRNVVPPSVLAVDWVPAPEPKAEIPRPPPTPAAKRSPAPATVRQAATPAPDATLLAGARETPVASPAAPVHTAAPAAAAPTESAPVFDAAYLRNAPPAYPSLSRRLGEQGKVQLRVFVDSDGKPETVEVKTGSGSPRLDAAALEAVRQWRFAPAKRGDAAVGAWVVVPIVFHLER